MKTIKKLTTVAFGLALFGLVSCSPTRSLPYDDVYYSTGDRIETANVTPQHKTSNLAVNNPNTSDYKSYKQANVVAVNPGNANDSSYSTNNDYYDGNYGSRLKRFHQSDNSDFGYYDDYYTSGSGSNPGYNSGGSNVFLNFGSGGYNGWSLGYSYGYPYYGWGSPYSDWGYSNWGYPYYGWGSSYYGWGYPYYGWGGSYLNGYLNGYLDGYYGGGFYPGYSDYGSGASRFYRPRNNRMGGSHMLRNASISGGSAYLSKDDSRKTVVAGYTGSRPGNTSSLKDERVGNSSNKVKTAVGYRVKPEAQLKTSSKQTVNSRMKKPESEKTRVRQTPVNSGQSKTKIQARSRYSKPLSYQRERNYPKPRYQKPKQYQRLDTKRPRGSKEYYRPNSNRNTNPRQKIIRNEQRQAQPRNRTRINTRQERPRRQNVYRPSRSNTQRTSPSNSWHRIKSYSSPSRRSTFSPRSYSAPIRSRSGGGTRSYSAPSRSYSTGGSRSGSSSHSSSYTPRGGRR